MDVASLSLAAAQCLLDVDLRSSVSVNEREETAKKLGRLSREQIRLGAIEYNQYFSDIYL